ncbi:4a-hydroxytetrahydrobiopterin dehydratase [Nocardia goodfellowii]|uniref:Putative pterin-4-alpha-carbinolamine dehydratase n=1 Tax=Nocardia goodfellowii TaxID=882446 RepID=A0ABS4QCG8_9NOCA|nr:4a-hydroxytetrahydrobiopterin dehydratase [Nocardia goodfellowii]MBP2189253.1 4a-hydroxytetrahydrobiopterin dehydratase [Nocardia goodfellowii]
MSTPLLSDAELTEALAGLTGWTRSGDTITRTVQAPAFLAGIELVRQVADIAETMNHHPDIDIRWRKLTFALSTHDAGGLTALDIALAREIDRLAAQSDSTD